MKLDSTEIRAIFSFITLFAGIIFLLLFIPIYNIECSNNNTCSIYSRKVLLRKPKLINMFNKSDIYYYKIQKSYKYTSRKSVVPFCRHMFSYDYQIYIYLKQGEIISMVGLDFNSEERAQEVYNNMINNSDFKLKGNFWKAFCGSY